MAHPRSILHVRCGSDIASTLQRAGIEGAFFEYSDPYCRGPVPADPALRFAARLDCIVETWGQDRAETCAKLEQFATVYDRMAGAARVILWFEHDLYDQPILWDLLAGLSTRPDLRRRCELVSTDAVEGVADFRGFGQLSPEQLRTQLEMAQPITQQQCQEGLVVWQAFCAPDPTALRAIAPSPALPYARRAIDRHLAEFPHPTDGLSLTQRLALQAIEDGAATPGQVFRTVLTQTDPLPFLGDLMFFADLHGLRDAPKPALTRWTRPDQPVALTAFGRALLAGRANWIHENGVDVWRGGVHLHASPQVP